MKKLIGNTPLIQIQYRMNQKEGYIYAKVEYTQLTGSIKDRMADYILKQAKENNELLPNQPIIEATSGNTGIAFSALGAYYKHPVHIFMPDWVSIERVKLMKMYGAQVHLVSKEEGGFVKCIEQADKLAEEIHGYRPNQFSNQQNVETHYQTTGKEIIEQLPNIEAFVSGIGTGGTLMGIGRRLKQYNQNISIFALEPKELPILTEGKTEGEHKIEGIGDEFIPAIVDTNLIEEVYTLHDEDCINMAKKMAKELGLGVGISSGANILAAILVQTKYNKITLTILPDDSKKYLSTDLSKEILPNESFLSNKIELIDYKVI